MSKTIIELKNVTKTYIMGEVKLDALKNVSFKVEEGEFLSIMGASGSGKSTMMHIIGALDLPTKGETYISGEKLSNLPEDELAEIRGKKIGFVFQEFNLIKTLTALENVTLPALFQDDIDLKKHTKFCEKLLKEVGLEGRFKHKPTELSGGQQQRVAIARALSNNPDIILADEPTGALDSKSAKEIITILKNLNKKGKTIIIITHNKLVAKEAKREIVLKDGEIIKNIKN